MGGTYGMKLAGVNSNQLLEFGEPVTLPERLTLDVDMATTSW
jgi:hypothetical protein